MNILVLNGSPKGEKSITLQTLRFLEKKNSEDHFSYVNVAARIRGILKDPTDTIEQMKAADLVVFSYPVYTFMAPSQLHSFVALLKEKEIDFAGKYMTQVTTSKHFYDVTAHRYIEDNASDLGFTVLPGLSADMDDLTKKAGQKQAVDFLIHTKWLMEKRGAKKGNAAKESVSLTQEMKTTASAAEEISENAASVAEAKPAIISESGMGEKNSRFHVNIVTDAAEGDTSLISMIEEFRQTFGYETRVINLHEFPFQGGCLGCLRCAATGICIYKDGFDKFLREEIQATDAIVYAFTIKDHSMGHLFKMYDDRQFCNGHRTVLMGRPIGYLVSGEYSKEENLQMIIKARAQVGETYLAGVATDEIIEAMSDTAIMQESEAVKAGEMALRSSAAQEKTGLNTYSVSMLSEELTFALEHSYLPPKNFYGAGGMRIFRDLIYQMQGIMKQDHKFFKEHGQYDFPQNKRGTILAMYLVGMLFSNPKLMKKMGSKIDEGMMAPYKKVLDELEKEK